MKLNRIAVWLCLAAGLRAQTATVPWSGYGHDPQHTGLSTIGAQRLELIKWSTPVDLVNQGAQGPLFIHYGSPLVTAANTVVLPVRTTASNSYRVEAHSGANGTLLYTLPTDYAPPPHHWIPSYGMALSQGTRVYYPGAGGTVYYRDQPDSASGPSGQIAFYGNAQYAGNQADFAASVMISTPITADAAGNIYFGFDVTGSNPANLKSGLARIGADGSGSWISAAAAAQGDTSIIEVAMNCTPALSNDGGTVYFSVSGGPLGTNASTGGYLVGVSSATLTPVARIRLKDPKTGIDSLLLDDSSASPTVGPDGDVYYGVLESPCCGNDDRGWLLHFNSTLTQTKTPGAFGWDTTASVVPASLVVSYHGASSYLLFTKYNNYDGVGPGGNGQNKIAVLDPDATETDPITGATVMLEVITILGPTPEASGGVREWCINSGAIDPFAASAIANSEDGVVYRWSFATNSFTQQVRLTSGVGEAYTPTAIGADGTAYAINDANLFGVGQASNLTITSNYSGGQTPVYTLAVTNSGSGATNGTVQVTDTLSAGLTASSIGGLGWSCTQPSGPCLRNDPLGPGASYSPIVLAVSGGVNNPATVTNTATVSSDGAPNSVNSTAVEVAVGNLPAITMTQIAAATATYGGSSVVVTTNVGLSNAPANPPSLPAACTVSGAPWLTANSGNPTSLSATAAPFNFTLAPSSLAPGSYTGTIACTTTGGITAPIANAITVALTVNGALTVTPASASLGTYFQGTSPLNLNFSIASGPGGVPVTIASSATWLTTPGTATTPAAAIATLQSTDPAIANAPNGTVLSAAITITAPQSLLNCAPPAGSGSLCTVTLSPITVTIDSPPALTLTPLALIFDLPTGALAVASSTVSVTDSPMLPAAVTATTTTTPPGGQWLSATSGTTPYASTVMATSGSLAAGSYTGAVLYTIGNTARTASVPVVFNIGQLTVTGGPVNLVNVSGAPPAMATLNVAAGTAAINWVAAAPVPSAGTPSCNWLTQSATSGTTPRGGASPIGISYNPAFPPAANTTWQCTINYSATPGYGSTAPAIPVVVNLSSSSAPVFTVSPNGTQNLSALVGSTTATPASVSYTISYSNPLSNPPNTTGLTVTPSAANPAGVFSFILSSPTTPVTLTVTANPTGLGEGTYTGTYTIAPFPLQGIAPVTVTVALVVTCQCNCVVSPTGIALTNSVPANGITPVTATSFFTVAGGPAISCPSWTATSDSPWLIVVGGSSGNGGTPVTGAFMALSNPTSLSRTGNIIISPLTGAPVAIPVTQPGSTAPPQDRQVTALYQSILGRDPDSAGYGFWTGPGAPTGVAALSQMADDFLTSQEAFNTDFAVLAAYQAATGAAPTDAAFANSVRNLRVGNLSIPSLFTSLIAGNVNYSATTLYQNLLNRAPGPGDAGCLATGLAACFETIIGYPAIANPADAPNNEFQSTGTFANITSARGDHTNTLYIDLLYFVILDRDPDLPGLSFWAGIANSGGAGLLFQGPLGYPARLQILGPAPPQGFIGSVEFHSLFQ